MTPSLGSVEPGVEQIRPQLSFLHCQRCFFSQRGRSEKVLSQGLWTDSLMKPVQRYSKEINDLILQVDKNQDYKARTRASFQWNALLNFGCTLDTSWTHLNFILIWNEFNWIHLSCCQISYDEFATFLEMGKGGGTEQHSSTALCCLSMLLRAAWNETGSHPKPATGGTGGGMKTHRDAWKFTEMETCSVCWHQLVESFHVWLCRLLVLVNSQRRKWSAPLLKKREQVSKCVFQLLDPPRSSPYLYGRICPWITTWWIFQEQESNIF